MRVKCNFNTGRSLPDDLIDESWGLNRSTSFPLIECKEYNVYAMTVVKGYIWYYICDETYTFYPVWRPSPLFSLTCPRFSRHWILVYHSEFTPMIAFRQWIDDPLYYERLVDGEDVAVNVFKRWKSLMDRETYEENM
jgi:hypothetical protein